MLRSWWFGCWVCLLGLGMIATTARAEEPEEDEARAPRQETWFLEIGVGASGMVDDAYVDRLHDFGFESDLFGDPVGMSVQTVGYQLHRNFGLLVRHEGLERRRLSRYHEGGDDTYEWNSQAVSLGGRGRIPIFREWFALYAQLDVGLGFARTRYRNMNQPSEYDRDRGAVFAFLTGFDANFFKYGGAYLEAGYVSAHILENNFGDKHQDGGFTLQVGLRVRMLKGS